MINFSCHWNQNFPIFLTKTFKGCLTSAYPTPQVQHGAFPAELVGSCPDGLVGVSPQTGPPTTSVYPEQE